MLVNVNCQIIMQHDMGANRPPSPRTWRKALSSQTIIWAHNIVYALSLVYVTGYRILGALSAYKDIDVQSCRILKFTLTRHAPTRGRESF